MSGELSAGLQRSLEKFGATFGMLESRIEAAVQKLVPQNSSTAADMNNTLKLARRDLEQIHKHVNSLSIQVDQMQHISESTLHLTSSLDLIPVLENISDTIVKLTGAERTFVVLIENGDLKIYAARNWDQTNVVEDDHLFSSTIVNETIEGAQAVLTVSAMEDNRFQRKKSVMAMGLRSAMCVPLMIRGAVIGVIYADNREQTGLFNEETVSMVGAFARQAGVAIENARLFEQINRDLRQAREELAHVRISIDEEQVQKTVEEITESSFFQRLQTTMREIRQQSGNEGTADSPKAETGE